MGLYSQDMTCEEVLIPDKFRILGPGFSVLGVEEGIGRRYKYDLYTSLAASGLEGQVYIVSRDLHNAERGQPARAPDFGKRRARMGLAVASRSHGARRHCRAKGHRRERLLREMAKGDVVGASTAVHCGAD